MRPSAFPTCFQPPPLLDTCHDTALPPLPPNRLLRLSLLRGGPIPPSSRITRGGDLSTARTALQTLPLASRTFSVRRTNIQTPGRRPRPVRFYCHAPRRRPWRGRGHQERQWAHCPR